jgi:hypothetical protein
MGKLTPHEKKVFLQKAPPHPVVYRNSGAEVNLRVRGLHWIAQHANTAYADFDNVSGNQRANASRGAGGDHVTGVESHDTRDPADEKRHGINQE